MNGQGCTHSNGKANGFGKMTVNYWIRSSPHIDKWHAYFSVARVKPVKCLFSHLLTLRPDLRNRKYVTHNMALLLIEQLTKFQI